MNQLLLLPNSCITCKIGGFNVYHQQKKRMQLFKHPEFYTSNIFVRGRTVQITFIFIDFHVCDFVFAFNLLKNNIMHTRVSFCPSNRPLERIKQNHLFIV